MGALRLVPKNKPLQFVPVRNRPPQSDGVARGKELVILIGETTLKIPEGADPETLKQVIRILRAP